MGGKFAADSGGGFALGWSSQASQWLGPAPRGSCSSPRAEMRCFSSFANWKWSRRLSRQEKTLWWNRTHFPESSHPVLPERRVRLTGIFCLICWLHNWGFLLLLTEKSALLINCCDSRYVLVSPNCFSCICEDTHRFSLMNSN